MVDINSEKRPNAVATLSSLELGLMVGLLRVATPYEATFRPSGISRMDQG